MFKLLYTKTERLTLVVATDHAALMRWKGDRNLKRSRLAFIEALIRKDHFYTPKWATADLNGHVYGVNGHHSSYVLTHLPAGMPFPEHLKVVIDHFRCDTLKDLADLFGQFDNRQSLRTPVDIMNAHGRIHDELNGLSGATLRKACDGIAWMYSDVEGSYPLGDEEKSRLVHDHIGFICWVSQFTKPRRLSRRGTVAAMFMSFGIAPAAATTFWKQIRDESHPDPKHPTRTYAKFLQEVTTLSPGKNQWKPRAFCVKAIIAWNAALENRTTSLKYHPNAPIPKMLKRPRCPRNNGNGR